METSNLVKRVQALTDLEIAMLLCLVADQSCIIQTEQNDIDPLEQELQIIASDVFGLSNTVLHCDSNTTVEDFSNGVLVDVGLNVGYQSIDLNGGLELGESCNPATDFTKRHLPTIGQSYEPGSEKRERKVANVVLVTGLHEAEDQIQIQALELLRTRRIYTHTAVHAAPKSFLTIFLGSPTEPDLVGYLNDHIYLSHYHDPEEGYRNINQSSDWLQDDHDSSSSVIHHSAPSISSSRRPSHHFPVEDIRLLADLAQDTVITAECMAYLHNLVVFLRLNRAVRSGASPTATVHFKLLSRILSSIQGYAFATPGVIGMAFRKIYRHRIKITTPDYERSMQYGSDLGAVSVMLKGVTADEILENVLNEVEVPV